MLYVCFLVLPAVSGLCNSGVRRLAAMEFFKVTASFYAASLSDRKNIEIFPYYEI